MKRTDIRAGVVYAVKSSYGPPSPIVFLEDGAAGLYGRGGYGRGEIRKLEENSYTKAKRGSGFSDSARGYAALKASWQREFSNADAAQQMSAADPAAELARFLADEKPSAPALEFEIVTSLSQINGLYNEELAAYEAQQQGEREARRRHAEQKAAAAERAVSLKESLSAYGIRVTMATDEGFFLKLDEADKLLALLRDREA